MEVSEAERKSRYRWKERRTRGDPDAPRAKEGDRAEAPKTPEERLRTMEYHFKIHHEGKGYWAECLELKGCLTQADTARELQKNLQEALNVYLDEPESSKTIFPLPKKHLLKRNVVAVPVAPSIAFSFLLRRQRLLKGLTQKSVADRLNVGLYSYQRLESSKRANPTLSTIVKLYKIFPNLTLRKLVA